MTAPTLPHDRDEVTRVNAVYHDAIANKYEQRLEGHHPLVVAYYRELFDRHVLPKLPMSAGAGSVRVLDFGCGAGYMEQYVTAEAFDVTGVDMSEGMLRRAAEKNPRAHYLKGDLYTFDPGAEGYHLVMENGVLHHLVDYFAVIERMAALTLPGGVLFLGNEPNQLAYRYLAPLKRLFRWTINRHRAKDAEALLGDASYEAISEYQLFYGDGLDARRIERLLRGRGFYEVRLFFSLRELFASIEEAVSWLPLNRVVPRQLTDNFPLSRNFYVVAYKR